MNLVKPALAAAVVMFIWMTLSWMALPFHHASLSAFPNEDPIRQSLANAPAGVYLLPNPKTMEQGQNQPVPGPQVIAAVQPKVNTSMGLMMGLHFLGQLLASLLAVWVALQIPEASYGRKILIFLCFGAVSSFVALLPLWNWWGFTIAYVGWEIADQIIGWTLAGAAAARLIRR